MDRFPSSEKLNLFNWTKFLHSILKIKSMALQKTYLVPIITQIFNETKTSYITDLKNKRMQKSIKTLRKS